MLQEQPELNDVQHGRALTTSPVDATDIITRLGLFCSRTELSLLFMQKIQHPTIYPAGDISSLKMVIYSLQFYYGRFIFQSLKHVQTLVCRSEVTIYKGKGKGSPFIGY